MGYGTFNIDQLRYKKNCKACGYQINGKKVNNIGFNNCRIIVTGVINKDDKDIDVNQEYIEDKNCLGTFLDNDEDMWMGMDANWMLWAMII